MTHTVTRRGPQRSAAAFLSSLALAITGLPAQGNSDWLPGFGYPGINGQVNDIVAWDPDGPGSAPAFIVFGGDFEIAGSVVAPNLAFFNPFSGQFEAPNGAPSAPVYSLTVDATNRLIVGGNFTTIGSIGANRVAAYDGSSWSALGTGVDGTVFSVALHPPSGDLIVGGVFQNAGPVTARRIARFDGTSWSSLLQGISSGPFSSVVPRVDDITVRANGDIVAVGDFETAGSVAATDVASFDGVTWSALGYTNVALGARLVSVAETGGADLVAGGNWGILVVDDGATWNQVPGVSNSTTTDITIDPAGNAIAATSLTANPDSLTLITGTPAAPVGNAIAAGGSGSAILAVGPNIYATGSVGVNAWGAARWNGAAWEALATGFKDPIQAVTEASNGDIILAGDIDTAPGGGAVNGIVAFDGTTFTQLGTGYTSGTATDLLTASNGDVYLSGTFQSVGGVTTGGLARWDGSSWNIVGGGFFGSTSTTARAIIEESNGDITVAGRDASSNDRVATFDGSGWFSSGPINGPVNAILRLDDGDLVAGGSFTDANGFSVTNIARNPSGGVWNPVGNLGALPGEVNALLEQPNGDIVAGGSFFGGVQFYDEPSNTWNVLGSGLNGTVESLTRLPIGDIVALGNFTMAGSTSTQRIARWNGTSWSAVDGGLDFIGRDAVFTSNEQLAVVGEFRTAGGDASVSFARLESLTVPTVTPYGVGCASTAGPLRLTALNLPWIGQTFEANCTGMPTPSLAVGILGDAQVSVPLSNFMAEAKAGCLLLADTDVLTTLIPNGSNVLSTIAVPPSTVYIGQTLWHQVAALELDSNNDIVEVTSSNGLELTFQAF